jgi:recombination protein RecR
MAQQFSSQALIMLIDELRRLPGVGKVTAQRLAFHILKGPSERALALSEAIRAVKERIRYCSSCWNITESETCNVCHDVRRDQGVICVVEEPKDVLTLERTGEYRGLYHVLHGAISPLDKITPEDIRVRELILRLGDQVREVIIATNPNIEGDATAIYLARLIKPIGIRVTRLARGLPMGGDLEYADDVTLARALEGRTEL